MWGLKCVVPPTETECAYNISILSLSFVESPPPLPPPHTHRYALGDIPLFVRAGAVIPTRSMASAYLNVANPLIWVVAPGASHGNGVVYEDDGDTMMFRTGKYQTTTLIFTVSAASSSSSEAATAKEAAAITKTTTKSTTTTTVDIKPLHADGGFPGSPQCRTQWIVLRGAVELPTSASCDGRPLAARNISDSPGFWLDPATGGSLVVACGGPDGCFAYSDDHHIVINH
jgi:hypothetical protein